MPLLRKLAFTGAAIATGSIGLAIYNANRLTRAAPLVSPLPDDDPVYESDVYQRYFADRDFPHKYSVGVTRRIPLWRIRPEFRDSEEAMLGEFARLLLFGTRPRPKRHLWDYHSGNGPVRQRPLNPDLGTCWKAVDGSYMEIVEKTPSQLAMVSVYPPEKRGLMTRLRLEPGPGDETLEAFTVEIDREKKMAVFTMKSCSFSERGPFPRRRLWWQSFNCQFGLAFLTSLSLTNKILF